MNNGPNNGKRIYLNEGGYFDLDFLLGNIEDARSFKPWTEEVITDDHEHCTICHDSMKKGKAGYVTKYIHDLVTAEQIRDTDRVWEKWLCTNCHTDFIKHDDIKSFVRRRGGDISQLSGFE